MSADPITRRAVILQHHPEVTLGNLEPVLRGHGYDIRIVDATRDDVSAIDPAEADLLIVLGGHQGAYETELHPHIAKELTLIRARIDAELPIFGVCLGAQLMAASLGERVYKGERPDISYRSIEPTEAGLASAIRHVVGVPMLEWHGDTFDLPNRVTRLAGSAAYSNEAFAIGNYALAVQFHPEVTDEMHQQWTDDTRRLLDDEGIDLDDWHRLRERHNPAMQEASRAMFGEWLEGL